VFRDRNATVSIFWSPFLVSGVEKSERDGVRYNQALDVGARRHRRRCDVRGPLVPDP
jgi:hypothetical protein